MNNATSGKSENKLSCQALSAHTQSQMLDKYSFPLSHLFFLVFMPSLAAQVCMSVCTVYIKKKKKQVMEGNIMKLDLSLEHAVFFMLLL